MGGKRKVHHANKNGGTDLHLAVAFSGRIGDMFGYFYSCIDLLMS